MEKDLFYQGMKEEVDFYLNNNIEDERLTKMSKEQFDKLVRCIVDSVLDDDQLNNEISSTIDYYYQEEMKEKSN